MTGITQWVKDAWQLKSLSHSKRSTRWPEVRKQWLELNAACAACGGTEHLQVHHKVPFHIDPLRELDPSNFITLCEDKAKGDHHLMVGHLGSWRKYNPNVVADAQKYNA